MDVSDSTTALLVLAAVILVFIWNRLPVGIVALGTATGLWALGLLTLEESLAGFGDPVVLFIATLFVISDGIDRTGLTTWAGAKVSAAAGEGHVRLLVAIMLLCATLTALISLNGAVAALLPMAVVVALRTARPASRMLMPMVFAGSAGSLLVLTGSPVNIIVSEASREAGAGAFAYLEFAWIGVPVLAGTVLLAAVLGPRLLPDRSPASSPRDYSRHAETLASYYEISDGFYRLRVRVGSPLLGIRPDELELSDYPNLTVVGLQASLAEPGPVRHQLDVDDVLVVSGPSDEVSRLAVEKLLAVAMSPLREDTPEKLINREAGVVEAVVPPRSSLVGETVFPGMLRRAEIVILAIRHHGTDTGHGPWEVRPGDALLLWGTWSSIDTLIDDRDVLVIDSPDLVRRQVPLGPRARHAAVILVALVLLLATGAVPPAIAGILGAGAMVLTRVIPPGQAYRAVSWETVVLVGGLIPLSTAIQSSGAGERVAETLLDVVGTGRPLLLLVALFVLTSVLGLVLSNTATVLIVLPIALAAASEGGVAVQPTMMMLAVAASAALLTPVQTPGNMMVMAPGGYRFGDYWKLGLPILLLWLAIAVVVIPLVWPL